MLKHSYKSLKSDPVDATLVGATKWNDDHYFLDATGAPIGALGDLAYRGAAGVVSLVAGAAGVLQSAGAGQVPAYTLDPVLTTLTVTGAITAGSIVITGGGGTISGPELGVLDGVTPGVVLASKAVVVDGNKDIASFRNLTAVNLTATTLVTTPVLNGATTIAFQTAAVTRWWVSASAFYPNVDNAYDLGGTAVRPRFVFAGTSIVIGTNPAAVACAIRLPNGASGGIWGRNAANTNDVRLMQIGSGDAVYVGHTTTAVVMDCTAVVNTGSYYSVGVNPAATGAIRIPNNTHLKGRNAANTADVPMIQVGTDNVVYIGNTADAAAIYLGYTAKSVFPFAGNSQDFGNSGTQWNRIYGASYNSSNLTGTLVTNDPQVVANAAIISLGPNTVSGLLVVAIDGNVALILLNGLSNTTTIVAQTSSLYTTVAGTASKWNVYWSAANSRYELENRIGYGVSVRMTRVGV